MTTNNENAAIKSPTMGEQAPQFRARTTLGTQSLSDYLGRWLVFFSHPSDFTPVCTSEFVAFARAHQKFQKLGCDLLGMSVDSLASHLAWQQNIKSSFGVEVTFPIVEDPSMAIARARLAHRTAATWRTGSPATGTIPGSASSRMTACSTAA